MDGLTRAIDTDTRCPACRVPFNAHTPSELEACRAEIEDEPRADDPIYAHTITVPASRIACARLQSDPLHTFECTCGHVVHATDIGVAINEHLDPDARKREADHDARFWQHASREEDRLQPYADALDRWAPLFAEVEHTGGGIFALFVTIGQPQPSEKVLAITDSEDTEGGWTVGIYANDEEWHGATSVDPDFFEIAPTTDPEKFATDLIDRLTERGILTAPVAREED